MYAACHSPHYHSHQMMLEIPPCQWIKAWCTSLPRICPLYFLLLPKRARRSAFGIQLHHYLQLFTTWNHTKNPMEIHCMRLSNIQCEFTIETNTMVLHRSSRGILCQIFRTMLAAVPTNTYSVNSEHCNINCKCSYASPEGVQMCKICRSMGSFINVLLE